MYRLKILCRADQASIFAAVLIAPDFSWATQGRVGSLWESADEGVPDAGGGRIDPSAPWALFARPHGQSARLGCWLLRRRRFVIPWPKMPRSARKRMSVPGWKRYASRSFHRSTRINSPPVPRIMGDPPCATSPVMFRKSRRHDPSRARPLLRAERSGSVATPG